MENVVEIKRLKAPAAKPQSLAIGLDSIWIGSIANKRVYQLDPDSWKVNWEVEAPGLPYGMTVVDGELRVLCSETEEDHRVVRRLIPGHGFDTQFALPCPDDTGSQLSWDGARLHVSQWYKKQVLALSDEGEIVRTILSPRGICGQVIVGTDLYLLNTDDEESTEYFITRFDLKVENPVGVDLAQVPFHARALAFDGVRFWTNHRAAGETVCFRLPE